VWLNGGVLEKVFGSIENRNSDRRCRVVRHTRSGSRGCGREGFSRWCQSRSTLPDARPQPSSCPSSACLSPPHADLRCGRLAGTRLGGSPTLSVSTDSQPRSNSPLLTAFSGSISSAQNRPQTCPEMPRNPAVIASLPLSHGPTRGISGSL
jgi:hypothetical protein